MQYILYTLTFLEVKPDGHGAFKSTYYWNGKDSSLGNNLKMTFPVSLPHIPLKSWPNFSKPGAENVALAQYVGRKATRKYNS